MVSASTRPSSRIVRWFAGVLRIEEDRLAKWGRLIITAFLVTLSVYAARELHLLRGIETRWLDTMAEVDRPSFDAPVTVVTISDADYFDPSLFGGMSPLDPGALAHVLGHVLDHRPKGLIVDVQLHPAFHESAERAQARLRLYRMLDSTAVAGGPAIVLVRDLAAERRERTSDDTMRTRWEDLTKNDRIAWADPTLMREGGYVRTLPCYKPSKRHEPTFRPTILGAAITAFGLEPRRSIPGWLTREEPASSSWNIRYTGMFLEDSSRVTPYRTDCRTLLSTPIIPGQRSLLANRIVLVGGTYLAGRDFQPTVVGSMAGVYVWAEAIASWIRHDALCEPRAGIVFALELLIGILTGFLLVRFGPAFGLLYSLLIVGPLCVLFSLMTFGDRILFVSFLPSFVAVCAHYQVEVHHELRALRLRLALSEGQREQTLAPSSAETPPLPAPSPQSGETPPNGT
jgi:CHASE2 domain-containing sensor protein